MSAGDRFADYMREVPFELDASFFPLPEIQMPSVEIPSTADVPEYDFSSELSARDAYKAFKEVKRRAAEEKPTPRVTPPPQPAPVPSATTSTISMSAVLIPEQAAPPRTASFPTFSQLPEQPAPMVDRTFEEMLVGKRDVFDELAIRTIDDRTALQQLLVVNPVVHPSIESASLNGASSSSTSSNHGHHHHHHYHPRQ